MLDIHLRNVLDDLISTNCNKHSDFQWLKQMRFYWEEEKLIIRQNHASFVYGYEFIGTTSRLVITPLTGSFIIIICLIFKKNVT